MKRYLLGLLAGMMIFSALGCSKEEKSEESFKTEDSELSTQTSNQEENERISNKLIKQSKYDTIANYVDYLEKAEGDIDEIGFFLDEFSDEEHVVTVENKTNLFFYSDFKLDSTDENNGFLVMARPKRFEYCYRHFDDVPETYVVNDYEFYKFTYPDADFDYVIEDDGDGDYVWENVVVAAEHNNPEDLTVFAKRMYAECVLTDLWYEFYYVFNDDVEKVEYNEYYLYDLSDAVISFSIDLETKQISFYERIDGEWEDSVVIEMD